MKRLSLLVQVGIAGLLLAVFLFCQPQPVAAAPQSCDEAGLNAAIAGGGSHTFDCGGPTTITISGTKVITTNVTLDGGDLLTISGGDVRQVFIVNSGITLTLQNLTISYGRTETDHGGGIHNYGTVNLIHANLSNNYSAYSGGGIYDGTINITDSRIDSNTSGNGGGVQSWGYTITINSSTFTNNTAGQGGAISYGAGQLNIQNSTFSNNTSSQQGGALYISINSMVNIQKSTFSGNKATNNSGGALIIYGNSTANIANSTFSNNQSLDPAWGAGGAIYTMVQQAVNITNSTFYGNRATHGGALYSYGYGTTRIQDSLITGSSGGDCELLADPQSIPFTGSGNLTTDTTCPGRIGAAVRLDTALTNNGGPTETHALLPRNNAANSGTICQYVSSGINPFFTNGDSISTDQRGEARLEVCDIGAFEYYGPIITTDPQGQIIVSGQTTTLTAAATGPGTLTYQWYEGAAPDINNPLYGETNPTFTTPPITQATTYWVRVTNEYDKADSLDAVLTINVPPQITKQPASQPGTPGAKVTLSVTATGTPTLTYQWYAGDSGDISRPIPGATAATYTTPSLFSEHRYWVRVSNLESADSDTAVISLNSPAGAMSGRNYFTTQPVTLTWSAIPGAVGYELEVARDSAFANKVPTGLALGAGDLTASVTVPDNGTYYWRVRAKKSPTVFSGWSAADSFIVDLP